MSNSRDIVDPFLIRASCKLAPAQLYGLDVDQGHVTNTIGDFDLN
jgi:hypothetical protein